MRANHTTTRKLLHPNIDIDHNMETTSFEELGLREDILAGVKKLGYEQPSQIQAKTIPVALTGIDIVGLSQTGSGKTAAFTLPALQKIDLTLPETQLLILCPTRELSVQVCEEVNRLAYGLKGFSAVPVYGGAPMDRQTKALRSGAQVVVGTPGRVMDHLKRRNLRTNNILTVILDEADRMLDMGFKDDMEEILSQIPEERQTLFFSATMNKQVKSLISHFGKNPETIQIQQKALTVSSIEQSYYEVRNRSKIEVLCRLLDLHTIRLGIIFCNTKRMVEECYESLHARGYSVDRLHGDITQNNRDRIFKRFRDGGIELLIATDVAARGLDIDEIDIVFNYDLPQDPEDYVHRIGRTGRAGRSGTAVSFVFGKDVYRLESIERYIKHTIRREEIPSQEDIEGKRAHKLFEQIKERLDAKKFTSQATFVDRLLEQGHTPTDITSALFCMIMEEQGRESNAIDEDSEPIRSSSDRRDRNRRPKHRGSDRRSGGGDRRGGGERRSGGGGFKGGGGKRSFSKKRFGGGDDSRRDGGGNFKKKKRSTD